MKTTWVKVQGVVARQAEWAHIHGNHQVQRSMTVQTGRTQDCTRPAAKKSRYPLQREFSPRRHIACFIADAVPVDAPPMFVPIALDDPFFALRKGLGLIDAGRNDHRPSRRTLSAADTDLA